MVDFRNDSDRDFESIQGESVRVYDFGVDGEVRIENPVELHRSGSGHYVFDALGAMHFIPEGWLVLRWEVYPDSPHIWL